MLGCEVRKAPPALGGVFHLMSAGIFVFTGKSKDMSFRKRSEIFFPQHPHLSLLRLLGNQAEIVCASSLSHVGLKPHGLSPIRLLCPWVCFLGKNTGVGCHALLQGIFPTQGLNPVLPHCRQILYLLSHQHCFCPLSLAYSVS